MAICISASCNNIAKFTDREGGYYCKGCYVEVGGIIESLLDIKMYPIKKGEVH